MPKKVFVGLSGGVDSSVTAALLIRQGYDVTGVYMKNWSQDLPGMVCSWKQDYQDAKRAAVHLGIPFKTYDFQTEYRRKVVDYMIREYSRGRTPNPDIMCNQEVKFKLFLETALNDGADMIATGHYARINSGRLLAGIDKTKDQSYFLCRVNKNALEHCLMPIGSYKKTEVRNLARKFGLANADKQDSQGICFIGKVGIKEFLLNELGEQPHGEIVDQAGRQVGTHDGAIFYTIGQRHGLNVGGGLPYYVTAKDLSKNIVYVTTDLQDDKLWESVFLLSETHWINGQPADRTNLSSRLRYRSAAVEVKFIRPLPAGWELVLNEEVRAATPGQSAVIYDGDICLGGGIITDRSTLGVSKAKNFNKPQETIAT
jgi:tRNA-uridine 2-sulfurtransferase